MEKRSRPTSVRISEIFHSFTEEKVEQQNYQPDLLESKRKKNVLKGKVGLFSFKRRTKSENEVTKKSKSISNIRQISENELTLSVPFRNSGEELSVHYSDGDERCVGQTCNIPNSKVHIHAQQINKDVKLRDKNQFTTKMAQSQPGKSLNQQQQIRPREISSVERKCVYLDARKTPEVFRFPLEEDVAPSTKQGCINKMLRKEKCAETEERSKSGLLPVLVQNIPVRKSVFLDVSSRASVKTSIMFQNSATGAEENGNREAESPVVPNKDGERPESVLSDSCYLVNESTTPETKLDECESSKITGSKAHPNKLTICEKSRFSSLRRRIWLMFISIISLPYWLLLRMMSVFICVGHICKSAAYAALYLVQSAFKEISRLLSKDKKQKEVKLGIKGFKAHSTTITPSLKATAAVVKLQSSRDTVMKFVRKFLVHDENVQLMSSPQSVSHGHEMNIHQGDMNTENEKTVAKKIALMFKKLDTTKLEDEGKICEYSCRKKQYRKALPAFLSKLLHVLFTIVLFLPLQIIHIIRFISRLLKINCRSLFFAVKTTNPPDESPFVIKQGNTVPKDQLKKKGKIKFSSFIRQISQSLELSSMSVESTEDLIPEKSQRLSLDMKVKSSSDAVMSRKDMVITCQKNRQLKSPETNETCPRYLKLTFQMIAASLQRVISLVVLCSLQLLWLFTRVPNLIFTCVRKAIVFVVSLPYVILLSFTKVSVVLAKVFYKVLQCIILAPITLLNLLFTFVLYIFTKSGKFCSMIYQYIKRIVICKGKHLEGMPVKTYDFEKTSEQLTQVSHQRMTPSLPQKINKDLENRNENLLRQNTLLLGRIDSKEDGVWKNSVLLKESGNVELDFEEVKESKVVWYSPTQNIRKFVTFSVDFFCYLFFIFLLLPISIIAFLKPAICFVAHIWKIFAQCKEDDNIFNDENVVIDSLHSNELDILIRPPNLCSEFQHVNRNAGKTCGIYGLINLRRKFKKVSKKNLEPELSSNDNLESEISVNGESIMRRTPSFTQMTTPEIKLQEKAVEECICDPRPYIRRFITSLRISFQLLSIFMVNSSHRVNVVLHASLYHFACGCKVIISFVIRLTPRKWLKWLLIGACYYLPDLRNRSLQLKILKATPSRVSKKLVEIYVRRVSLSVMYLHVQASLRDSPSKKIFQNLAKIWTTVKILLETVFLTVSTAFKMVSRSLKAKRKENVVKTTRRSLLRLISKDTADKEIIK